MENKVALVDEALGEVQAAIDLVSSILPVSDPILQDVVTATIEDIKIAHGSLEDLYTLLSN